MSRTSVRVAAATVALLASTVGLAGSADAATPASGNATVGISRDFNLKAAAANISASVAAPATSAPDSTTGGVNATFPVTGGYGGLTSFWGAIQLGGTMTVSSTDNGKSVTFANLVFNIDNWRLTGVPQGGTAAVQIIEPQGGVITTSGTTQNLNSSTALLDAQGAQYLDTALSTTFFTAGQNIGTFSLTYTPAS